MGKQKDDKVLATVGNRNITVKEFLYGYEFGPSFPKKANNSKERYLNYLINEKLLSSEASDRKLDTSALIKNNYIAIEADLASEELFKDKILPRVVLSKEQVSEGYKRKFTKVELEWLYAPTPESLISFAKCFKKGLSFDSLYSLQFGDSVLQDERSMTSDLFKLGQNNIEIAKAIDTLKIGEHSRPVKGQDGWYIFKLTNKWKEISLSDVQVSEMKKEVETGLKKLKADSLSDVFVDSLISSERPTIKGNAFVILRAYLGNYMVDENKFREWKLKERGDSAITKLNLSNKNLNNIDLVDYKSGQYTINDFINWFQLRSQYYKVDDRNYNTFSASVESMIWRMVRDNILSKVSFEQGYQNKKAVKEQLKWWKDKLLFAAEREELQNSVILNIKKETEKDSSDEILSAELNRKLLSKINILKRKYKISINNDLLNRISVDDENNPNAIDAYAVKKDGILPRPAYPSIDFIWESWQ